MGFLKGEQTGGLTWIDNLTWNKFGGVGRTNVFDGSWNYFANFGDARFAATFDTPVTQFRYGCQW